MPESLDSLKTALDYDLWANLQWLDKVQASPTRETDLPILAHLLGAQLIWLVRTCGESPTSFTAPEPTTNEFNRVHQEWKAALTGPLDRMVSYRRLDGEAAVQSLGNIVRHVANHGTYHRGELRGLCRARGDEDFPETDYVRYCNLNGL